MRISLLILLFSLSALHSPLFSQALLPSNTYVRTCLSDIECSSIDGASFLYYDEATEKFFIKVDFNELKTGRDSVDFWLSDLDDTFLYFKASVKKENFPSLSSYNARTIRMDGQIFLNGIWRSKSIDMSLVRADKDMLSNTTGGGKYDAFNVNLSFSFLPKDFNIHKKPTRLSNTVFIGINAGRINLITSGMETQLGEAWQQ
jgi:hypothetical protein